MKQITGVDGGGGSSKGGLADPAVTEDKDVLTRRVQRPVYEPQLLISPAKVLGLRNRLSWREHAFQPVSEFLQIVAGKQVTLQASALIDRA
jgi:hypothetical protein